MVESHAQIRFSLGEFGQFEKYHLIERNLEIT